MSVHFAYTYFTKASGFRPEVVLHSESETSGFS